MNGLQIEGFRFCLLFVLPVTLLPTGPLEGDSFYYQQLSPATLGLNGSKNEWLALSLTPCCLVYALLGYLPIPVVPPMVFHIFVRCMLFVNSISLPVRGFYEIKSFVINVEMYLVPYEQSPL